MKIEARVTKSFNISKSNMKKLIAYASGDRSDEIANEVETIMASTFGDREGYIPGEWLSYYANELEIDDCTCDDIEI